MPAGRPATPTALKKLSGTYRQDRSIENEMMPSKLAFAPSAPVFLDKKGRMEWDSICAELADLDMLHRSDLTLLAAYCSEMSNYWKTVHQIAEEGSIIKGINKEGGSYSIQNPLIGIKNSYFNNANKLAVQFGLTPAARTRIGAPPKDPDGSFDDMMNSDD